MSRKTNALDGLADQVERLVRDAVKDVGELSPDERDDWFDALSCAVNDGLFAVVGLDG